MFFESKVWLAIRVTSSFWCFHTQFSSSSLNLLGRLSLVVCCSVQSPLALNRIRKSQRRDSNPRPADYKSAALPTELRWPAQVHPAREPRYRPCDGEGRVYRSANRRQDGIGSKLASPQNSWANFVVKRPKGLSVKGVGTPHRLNSVDSRLDKSVPAAIRDPRRGGPR